MAGKVAGELAGDRGDHSAVLAQEGKGASAREEYIRGLSLTRAPLQYVSCSSFPFVITV